MEIGKLSKPKYELTSGYISHLVQQDLLHSQGKYVMTRPIVLKNKNSSKLRIVATLYIWLQLKLTSDKPNLEINEIINWGIKTECCGL